MVSYASFGDQAAGLANLGLAAMALIASVLVCALLTVLIAYVVAIRGADPPTKLRLFDVLTSVVLKIVGVLIRRTSR